MCEHRPNFVFVRSGEGDESISLRFRLHGREHRFLRAKEEPLGKALKRIATNLSREDKHKKRKKWRGAGAEAGVCGATSDGGSTVRVVLYSGGCDGEREVSPETANRKAWVSGNALRLDDVVYQVTVNTPTVRFLQLPGHLLTTCPAVPLVELEFAAVEHCRWSWRRCGPTNKPLPPTVHPESAAVDGRTAIDPQTLSSSCAEALSSCPVISTSPVYWTAAEDSGYILILQCTPLSVDGEEGQPVVVGSRYPVFKFTNLPMLERHLLTPSHLADPSHFRVVSYNILANVYATSERARSMLYPYCDESVLDQEYRQCLIAKELLGYHGDIICLQEVGTKFFTQFLSPALKQWGYNGRYHAKVGRTPEGEAVFYNRSKFSLVQEEAVTLREFVEEAPNCRDILSLHPLTLTNLLKRHNILQLVLLQSTEVLDSYILVANTHLYFHPMGDHIRLLQVAISLRIIERRVEECRQRLGKGARIAVLFSGDFNSCPCTAAYSYVLSRRVSGSHPDWQLSHATDIPQCSCNHRALNVIHEDDSSDSLWAELEPAETAPASGDSSSIGLDLSHSLHFSNACGTRFATNVTLGWTGVIDYIFFDSEWLECLRPVPFPAPEHLIEHVALPSANFPSDHVALVADLTWRTEQNRERERAIALMQQP